VSVSVAFGVSSTCSARASASSAAYFTTFRCQCNLGFTGDGFSCVTDSDGDDYPDLTIPSCSATCQYCRQDSCPRNAAIFGSGFTPVYRTGVATSSINFVHNPSSAQIFNSSWSILGSNTVSQSLKSNPSVLLASDVFLGGYELSTTVQTTGTAGYGFFGLVFGYRGTGNFAVLQWKFPGIFDASPNPLGYYGTGLGNTGTDGTGGYVYYATSGLTLKSYFNNPTAYSLWTTNPKYANIDFSNQFKLLYNEPAHSGWALNAYYVIKVSYRPTTGYVRARAYATNVAGVLGALVGDTGDVFDTTLVSSAGSQLGAWSFQQGSTTFTNTGLKCCDGYIPDGNTADCFPYTVCAANQVENTKPTATSDRTCR